MELTLSHISKSFGGTAVLSDFSCVLRPDITCLMAPSGAGKTTLLRILMGLEQPDSGCIEGLSALRLSAVFQEDRLLEQLNWRENLRFVLGSAFDEEDAQNLLCRLGLEPLDDSKPVSSYSGGMRRRLALTRALLVPFDLLLLDEPFTGLDAENRARAVDCVRALAAGKLVLLVTHEEADVQALSARVLRFQDCINSAHPSE